MGDGQGLEAGDNTQPQDRGKLQMLLDHEKAMTKINQDLAQTLGLVNALEERVKKLEKELW